MGGFCKGLILYIDIDSTKNIRVYFTNNFPYISIIILSFTATIIFELFKNTQQLITIISRGDKLENNKFMLCFVKFMKYFLYLALLFPFLAITSSQPAATKLPGTNLNLELFIFSASSIIFSFIAGYIKKQISKRRSDTCIRQNL